MKKVKLSIIAILVIALAITAGMLGGCKTPEVVVETVVETVTENIVVGNGEISINLCYLPSLDEVMVKGQQNVRDSSRQPVETRPGTQSGASRVKS